MLHGETRTPRERRHGENLRRILDTAMGMVEEGGLEGLSVNRLADAVDYTPGALYRYFPSKAQLISALVVAVLEDVRRHLDAAVSLLPPRATPLARVFTLVQGYRAFARQKPQRFGLLAMTMAEPKILLEEQRDAAPVIQVMQQALEPLAVALAGAAAARQLSPGDPAERTIALFALSQSLLMLNKQARHAPTLLDVGRLLESGARALLIGWGGKPRSVDAAIEQVARLGDLSPRIADHLTRTGVSQ